MNEHKSEDFDTFLKAYYSILRIKAGRDFTITDKMVLLVILSLDDSKKHCFAKNKYISEILGLSEATVSISIGKLCEDLKLITRKGNRQSRILVPVPLNKLIRRLNEFSPKVIRIPNEDSSKVIRIPNEGHKDPLPASLGSLTNSLGSKDIIDKNKTKDKNMDNLKDNLVAEKKSATSPSSKSKPKGRKRRGPKKSTIVYEQDSIPYQLAEYYWAAQLVWDEKVHPEFKDFAKLEPCLQTWADEFDTLLTKQQLNSEEVERVILFVLSDRLSCYTAARYSAGYLAQHYLTLRDMMLEKPAHDSRIQTAILPHDPDRELTQLITEKYRRVYRPGGNFPDTTAQKHFRLVSTKAKKKYNLDSVAQKTNFVEELFHIAGDVWSSKGDPVMPWDLSGTLMWDYKMPQYYQNMGVPESMIGEIADSSNRKDEFEVEMMPEQKKVVEESDFPF